MARKKKTDETKVANGADTDSNGVGHNGPPELTDEQRQALFFQHKKAYQAALAVKKEADAKFKNVCKLAKSELGKDAVADIKTAIDLESDEGDEKVQAEVDRLLRVARWMGASPGQQFNLFDTSGVPATERAFDEGKRVGMAGEPKNPPYDSSVPQYTSWMEGWDIGQQALFGIQKLQDGEVFDHGDDGRATDPEAHGNTPEPESQEATAPAE